MGAFGSVLGGIMFMGSLFLGYWTAFVFTDGYIGLLLFTLFALLGGFALGALNSRKARQQAKYENEYTAYAGMMFAATIFLGVYYLVFAITNIEAKVVADLEANIVVVIAMAAGIMGQIGLGLTVANSIAE